MSVALETLQFELGGVVFGAGTDITLARVGGLGSAVLRSREYEQPGADGITFGAEYHGAKPLDFEGQIVAHPADGDLLWDRSDQLHAAFDGDDVRTTPRAVQELRMRRPGHAERLCYGRGIDYDPDITLQAVGLIPWDAQFRLSDPHWYDAIEKRTRVLLSAQSVDYIVLDDLGRLVDPITTTRTGRRSSYVTNEGTKATWPVLRFGGPLTNPVATLIGDDGPLWSLGINGTIAAGQEAVIDTRPWARSAALASGAPLPGPMTTDSVPSRSWIPPGQHELVVTGGDPAGTAYIEVAWRDAYKNP